MTEVKSIECDAAKCLQITTGNPDDANDSIYSFSIGDEKGVRTIWRNGSSFVGALRGVVGSKEEAERFWAGKGVFMATLIGGDEWVVPATEIKIGDRMAIELVEQPGKTLATRPIKKIEIL